MIEKLNNNDGVRQSQSTAGQRELLREYRNKLNEVIDAVNAIDGHLLATGPDDDICPDCRLDAFLDTLDEFDDDQLQILIDEAEDTLERRSQEEMKAGLGVEEDAPDEQAPIDTKDGLLSNFIAYVAEHPELRFYQAIS